MLIYSMSVSADGFIADREGGFEWTVPMAEEVAAALDATGKDVSIGGAGLAAAAIELGLVDELRMFRYPVVVGGGTPFLPPVTEPIALHLVETRTFGARVVYERYVRA
jgi:dihydrofolate reductase